MEAVAEDAAGKKPKAAIDSESGLKAMRVRLNKLAEKRNNLI